jgi:hypothetical protein
MGTSQCFVLIFKGSLEDSGGVHKPRTVQSGFLSIFYRLAARPNPSRTIVATREELHGTILRIQEGVLHGESPID